MIESPCVKICVTDPTTGYCQGCFRTTEEISKWIDYNDNERQAVLEELKKRADDLFRD